MNRPSRATAIVILAVFILVLATRASAIWKQRVAAACVADLARLQLNTSPYSDVQRIQKKYKSRSSVSSGCSIEHCTIEFSFSNDWLARMHLARGAFLRSTITVANNRVTRLVALAGCNPRKGGTYTASVWEEDTLYSPQPVWVGGNTGALMVRVNSSAKPQERQAALQFDTSFLSGTRACSSPADMLPSMAERLQRPMSSMTLVPLRN